MIDNLRITTLVENTAGEPDVLAEHGLAFWIEADGRRVLFDTGQGNVLQHNARQLGVEFDTADMVVLSHGHYDHTGGLRVVLGPGLETDVYLHPAALAPKFARRKKPPHRDIGIPKLDEQTIRSSARTLVWTNGPTELFPGVHVTGQVPRRNDFEDTGGPFFLDSDCEKPDPLIDDQAIYIETPDGIVVLLGCAHSGVANTLDYISELTGNRHIRAVLGGMHLVQAKRERFEATLNMLKRYEVDLVAPAHCTGTRAVAYLWSELPDRCVQCSTGSRFTFPADFSSTGRER